MEGSDDIDEDELALAMSTELSRPTHTVAPRRARSVTSLRNTEVRLQHAHFTYLRIAMTSQTLQIFTSEDCLLPKTLIRGQSRFKIDLSRVKIRITRMVYGRAALQ